MDKSAQSLLQQLSNAQGNHLLQQCIAALQELQKELEQQVKINQEQKHLINILQEGKEYYEQEYKNNSYQHQCQQLNAQISRITALANAHRKASQDLKETVLHLQENIQHLHAQLAEKDRQIEQSQLMLTQIKGEKQVLEKQWNKAIKAVKRKIAGIINQKQNNPEANKENQHDTRLRISKDGSNTAFKQQKHEKLTGKQCRQSLMERAYSMVAQLQKEEAIEEFENIFLNSQGSSHNSNKKRVVLKENTQLGLLFNSGYQ